MWQYLPVMKLKLTHTKDSFTSIHNQIKSALTIDFTKRQFVSANLHDKYGKRTLCLTVKHPLQSGETCYHITDRDELENTIHFLKRNNLTVRTV